jgi:hypothetical protein
MNDMVSGLIVAAVTAVAVAAIFIWTQRAKNRKIEALRSLCVRHGWNYEHLSGPRHHGHRITGDSWQFEAVSRSAGRETAPGSSDWGHSSRWMTTGEDPGRGTFMLGSRLGGMLDISRVPPSLLSRFLGDEAAGLRTYAAGERLDPRYVLFSREEPPAMGVLSSRAEELLLAWPLKLPLVVRSSPARLSLQVMNQRLEKPEDVARCIELGLSLAER